jgi:hypothetical protein
VERGEYGSHDKLFKGEFAMKKMLCTLFIVSMVLVNASGVMAYTFNDNTLVQEWNHSAVSGGWKDVIGDSKLFNTFGADLSGSTLTIFTNWNPSKDGYLGVNTADLFIVSGGTSYAIQLDTLTGTGNVYKNPAYKTSVDLLSPTGYTYGGNYDKDEPKLMPVLATSSTTGTTSVVWTIGGDNLNNKVAIDLSGIGSLSSFVWGTATCSNDGFSGTTPVPVPPSVLLLGSGILGMGLRRFRKI